MASVQVLVWSKVISFHGIIVEEETVLFVSRRKERMEEEQQYVKDQMWVMKETAVGVSRQFRSMLEKPVELVTLELRNT